jgi:hypothetical protein
MTFTDKGRIAEIEIQWKGYNGTEIAQVYILNDKDKYDELSADDNFDQRLWFYFQDETEFQSYFKEDNGDEWYIVREIKGS